MTAQSAPAHSEDEVDNPVDGALDNDAPGAELRAHERLVAAREAMGHSREQIAEETKIPSRSLVAIEEGDYGSLPSRTYAIGFSRTYARAVGLDENEIAEQVRVELDGAVAYAAVQQQQQDKFEPGDPARVASPKIAWFAALAGVAIAILGALTFWRSYFAPGADFPPLRTDDPAEQGEGEQTADAGEAAPSGPIAAGDAVVFTALADEVWVKFYDGNGRQLMQKIMSKGERYTVPGEADRPLLWTGRPEALGISVGGRELPRLSAEQVTMKDVPVSAIALGQRFGQPVEAASVAEPSTTEG